VSNRPKRVRLNPRRVAINGHQTSLRLEPEFWYWLRQIAAECRTTATKLIEGIVIAKHPHRSLSSALRVFVGGFFHDSVSHYGFPGPDSQFAVRFEKPRKSRKRGIKPASDAVSDAMITAAHRLQHRPK
jgi:predicted DNA-binding ribbon-helix-helix protein